MLKTTPTIPQQRTTIQFPIIYLHIPKTAGTSFRVSAREYFGKNNILSDYGEASNATSEEILNCYYGDDDIKILQEIGSAKKFFSGHFTLAKYREIFPDSPVMTFFRDPVKRVISEYMHFKNHFSYAGTLTEFYQRSQFQNRQHHTLSGAKPADLDFYGLTERYDDSLKMFNHRYGTKLPLSTLNQGNYQSTPNSIANDEQIEEIKHLNQSDMAIYKKAVENFENQSSEITTAKDIANQYQGYFGGIRDNKIVGWVFSRICSKPVTITIAVNGNVRSSVLAKSHRADIVRSGLHPDGNCGFVVALNEIGTISSGDSISVCTDDGKLELIKSPYIVR